MTFPQTLADLHPGDFFLFLPGSMGHSRYHFMLCRLLSPGVVFMSNTTGAVFTETSRAKLSRLHFFNTDAVMQVHPCKVCLDAASKAGGVEPCACWSLT